jgi:hypothetical protein
MRPTGTRGRARNIARLFSHSTWKRIVGGRKYREKSVRDRILTARTPADASSVYFDAVSRNRWASEGTKTKWRRALEGVQRRDLRRVRSA